MLLNQFHDVLPGPSIEMVYEDVDMLYDEVYRGADQLLITSLQALGLSLAPCGTKNAKVLSTLSLASAGSYWYKVKGRWCTRYN